MDENSEAIVTTTTPEEAGNSGSSQGEPIQIVKIDDEGDHSLYLDEESLTRLMNDERIKDKPLCIVSVAGESDFIFKIF